MPTSRARLRANGNLTKDLNKGIAQGALEYNLLNLVRKITLNANTLEYYYDAAGQKHQLIYSKPSDPTQNETTRYVGSMEWLGNNLKRIATGEGQYIYTATQTGLQGQYQYYLNDHLGNTRVVVTDSGKVLQRTDYYAFGLQIPINPSTTDSTRLANKYLYNGKELQPETGLLDYGARQYGAAEVRWFGIDPMSEQMRRWSPYNYAFNNPLRFIDPDGRIPGDFINEKGQNIGNDGRNDGRIYVIKTSQTEFDSGVPNAGITREQAKQTEQYVKANSGNSSAFGDGNVANANSIEIEGSASTRQQMVDIVSQDNGKGGRSDANNREYGGEISIRGEITAATPGAVADPSRDTEASVNTPNYGDDTRADFHSHPSGSLSISTGGGANTIGSSTTTTYSFGQAPSPHDIRVSGSNSNYVFGRSSGTVYIYNNTGVQATLPHKYFVNPKR